MSKKPVKGGEQGVLNEDPKGKQASVGKDDPKAKQAAGKDDSKGKQVQLKDDPKSNPVEKSADQVRDKKPVEVSKPKRAAAPNPKTDNVLIDSGLIDAYDFFLRQLCKNGLPSGNIFEYAAQEIMKFEKKKMTGPYKKGQMKIDWKKATNLPYSLDALSVESELMTKIGDKKQTDGKKLSDVGIKDKAQEATKGKSGAQAQPPAKEEAKKMPPSAAAKIK